ncbi:MAG: homoserine/threonine exporter, RhtB-like [Proteobacteria bacterium]|nr:homoserine/threonine exporter, RhtB-like [Pseudomonadota bacterium]
MELHTWFLYAIVALIAIISPGPAVLLAINNSVMYDLKAVSFSSLGNVVGLFVLSSAAMLGLGVVLKTSAVLFLTFKILGACYLIYIGIKQFRAFGNIFKQVDLEHHKRRVHYAKIFQKAFLSTTFGAVFHLNIDLYGIFVFHTHGLCVFYKTT